MVDKVEKVEKDLAWILRWRRVVDKDGGLSG